MSQGQISNPLKASSKTEIQDSSFNYLELLCKNTDDINKPNECGWTPLYRTIISGNNNATIELLEKGADPNMQSNMGETALYQAVEMEKKNQVDTLLLNGANPNISLGDGTTPLHCAVIKGNLDIMKTLLENGAFPNLKSKFFLQTPLHLAIKTKQSEQIIRMLLDYNASTIVRDKHGNKPVDYAEENSAIKNMLIEAEASQLGQVANMSNQNAFSVDDRVNSLMTKEDKNKDEEKNKEKEEDDLLIVSINPSLKDIISEVNHTENNEVANGSEKKRNKEEDEKDSFHLDTIQTPNEKNTNRIDVNELLSANGNDYNDNDNGNCNSNDNYNQEEYANEFNDQRSYLNDSLENDYNNNNASNRKKADYISDFPLSSSMKKKSEEEDDMYKKIIMAKRLSFNANSKISYHNKSTNEPTLGDNYLNNQTEQSNHQYNASLKVTPINSHHYSNNNISDRNRSNDNDHLNKTSENELNTKRANNTNNNTNYYSSFSTQPHSANTNSLQIKKQYLDDNNHHLIFPYSNDNDQYGKVSEFTIKNVTTRQVSSLQLSKMKKWLNSIDLIEHLNCFIDNEMCDIDRLKQVMINYNTKLKYDDFERIGIRKPGHIYRILTKLEIDLHSIDNKIIQFILPNSNHNRTNSIETKLNLKISEEYCCGCQNFIAKKTKLDLAVFLRKKTLQHLCPNFLHNGFDWLEYVLLQMYTDCMFKEEILEDMMHIYDVDDRNKVMKCLIDEMKRINLFVNSKEYMANIQNYKYGSIDLEKEEQEKPCQPCVIY